jgi:hypothetical protein
MKRLVVCTLLCTLVVLSSSFAQSNDTRPVVKTGEVRGDSEVSFTFTLEGGRPAMISLVGDGSSDLDLIIHSPEGKEMISSMGPHDRELVQWTPWKTGTYRVVVKNYGRGLNRFTLTVH